ncbi:MAG TPA: SDR family NAD(P)-dependent oxidoreductase [Myxococcaceae bacterium]|nr:SDR family NAD(P)-dependent oxidoreductase [Myxococcaceae bacterium]
MGLPLENRVALVTGASRGIGKAIALALADSGADVVAVSTTKEGAEAARDELRARGRRAIAHACDVGQPAEVDGLVKAVLEVFGRVDVLVNNAGIVQRSPMGEMTDADFDRVLRVNLSAPFYLARRLVPDMVKRGYGRIVNVSSISSRMGTPRLTSYCASKWGLNGLTQAMAEELKGSGVVVMGVLPGSVDTDMLKGSGFDPAMTPEQVAEVVRYLCAEAPAAMTGSLVEVFG